MTHFNVKSLTFYSVAIAAVLILFKTVTTYGEANIKAPPTIDGKYRLVLSPNADCPKPEPLLLTIQQSGIYVTGFLLPLKTNAKEVRSAEKNPALTGRLQNQQLSLSGIADVTRCNSYNAATPSASTLIKLSTQIQPALQGQIMLSNIATPFTFTAIKETPSPEAKNINSH